MISYAYACFKPGEQPFVGYSRPAAERQARAWGLREYWRMDMRKFGYEGWADGGWDEATFKQAAERIEV